MGVLTQYTLAILIGVAVGLSELLTRYPGNPQSAWKNLSSWIYILINGLTSLLALFLLQTFEVLKEPETTQNLQYKLKELFLAGLGGMAVLRASIMTLKVSGQEVSIGPAAFIQVFLNLADRGTDRHLANHRASIIGNIMNGIDFNKASKSLPTTCFALMTNVSADEQKIVGEQVGYLRSSDMANEVKCIILGLRLMDIVGIETLKQSIKTIEQHIKTSNKKINRIYHKKPNEIAIHGKKLDSKGLIEKGIKLRQEAFEILFNQIKDDEVIFAKYKNNESKDVAVLLERQEVLEIIEEECLRKEDGAFGTIDFFSMKKSEAAKDLV